MKFNLKNIFKDSFWTISGLMLMNVVAQFIVYPAWNRQLGSERYGDVLFLLSLMNIYAISMGTSCNFARMTQNREGNTNVSSFLTVLMLGSVVVVPILLLIRGFSGVTMSSGEWLTYGLLIVATMWRFYADVEYRLTLNYQGYFLYYLVISIGYGIGIFLSQVTGLWPLALLPGELMGLVLVFLKGKAMRWDGKPSKQVMTAVAKVTMTLFVSNAVSHIIFNGDRLLLQTLLNGQAVTQYYLASLLGKTMSLITTPLNSVIIGYLVRWEKKLDTKFMNVTLGLSLGATVLATFACTVGSYILIPILYPAEFASVRSYFVIANLTQVIYFVSNVLTVILLRFSSSRYQLYVNIVYAIAFVVICVPMVLAGGFVSFCYGLLLTSISRLVAALALGYKDALVNKRKK